jgi:GNAT superfamily N-acetyltransferase
MDARIDPPASALRLTAAALAEKAREETLLLATDGDSLIGCVFVRPQGDALYVGRLAVRADRRRAGIARRLLDAAAAHARGAGLAHLELETRIELTENHATFAALGFVKTAEHAHAGYTRPTYVTMRKRLDG